jgi:hypothetical protein
MSDFVHVQEAELLNAKLTMLLPDTLMMLTGETFMDMLPAVSGVKRGAKKQFDGGYSPSIRYSREEIEENPILALSPEEYRTLRLHMQGLKRGQIAAILGITEMGVGLRLQKYRVKAAKARLLEEIDDDLSSLMTKAADVYRDGVTARDIETRMKAAERIFKINGKGSDKAKDSGDTNMSPAQFMSTLLQNFETKINVDVKPIDYERPTEKSLDGDGGRCINGDDFKDCE